MRRLNLFNAGSKSQMHKDAVSEELYYFAFGIYIIPATQFTSVAGIGFYFITINTFLQSATYGLPQTLYNSRE